MTRIEHRLTDALAARAKAVDPKSIRPLPWAAPVRHRRERRRRWLAPTAAAVSIVAVAAVVTSLPRHAPRAGQNHPIAAITSQRASFHGKLTGVDALSATDAWAVGFLYLDRKSPDEAAKYQPLIMHWDGRSWRRVPTPSNAADSSLLAVSGSSPDDVWAVGNWTQSLHHSGEALILHWNGRNWRMARSVGSFKSSLLFGVSARSATDAWAVGSAGNNGGLLLHWNGHIWRQAPAPHPDASQYLNAVADISSSDAWAVGADKNGEFAIHWNGTSWRSSPVPDPHPGHASLLALSVFSASQIWAIGYGLGPKNIKVIHWNGTAWHVAPEPSLPALDNFWSVAVISPDDIWGAGAKQNTDVLINHWNGTSWSKPKGLNAHLPGLIFHLSVSSASDIWGVGYHRANPRVRPLPLILHWNGKSWTKVLS